ncbi:hypothetical protein XBO1_1900063 [Xenorhabdus bovienii str. oregonense]|uniref:Uncharacterized protein n=1 Tax=Xenorhabdus bovienii str. oregonense TaxID=1398202 RepID=A0A077P6L1_XENBV|nr:hypothetical protein XBO1_1900063 [Xenorhabdus bovienii str. oregonense]
MMVLILSFRISCYVLKYIPVRIEDNPSPKPTQTSIKHPFSDALENFVFRLIFVLLTLVQLRSNCIEKLSR